MRLACNLRRIREQKRISLREAEQRTGISRSYLSRIERGQLLPTDEQALAIARVYGRPPMTWYEASPSRPLILSDSEAVA